MLTAYQWLNVLQDEVGSAVPSHLCSWCAARVEDAYDLQQQCMKASQNLKQGCSVGLVKVLPTTYCLDSVLFIFLPLDIYSYFLLFSNLPLCWKK